MSNGLLYYLKNDKKYDFCKVAIVLVIVSAVIVILQLLAVKINPWEDIAYYYKLFLLLKDGNIPYKDFTFEYPPLSLIFIAISGFLSVDLNSFCSLYVCETVLFFILCLYYLFKIAEENGYNNKIIVIILLAMLVLINTRLIFRNDIFALFFVIVSFYYYSKDRYVVAFGLLALGVMTKIFPIVFACAFIVPFFKNDWREGFSKTGVVIASSAAICVLISIPWLIVDIGTAFDYLTYHSARGLQVESISASIISFINLFVPIAQPSSGYGSFNISGVIPDAIARLLIPLSVLMVVIVTAWCIYKERNISNGTGIMKRISLIFAILILVFVIFGKVFSEQYIVWIMLPVSIALFFNSEEGGYNRSVIMALAVLIMTPVAVIITMDSMNNLEPVGTLMILIRNIFVILLTYSMFKMLYDEYYIKS